MEGIHSPNEQNFAEMTPEFWRVFDCEELVGEVNHSTE